MNGQKRSVRVGKGQERPICSKMELCCIKNESQLPLGGVNPPWCSGCLTERAGASAQW